MNRRQFFGMSASGILLAGLPAMVLPERTIFLPPRFGWTPSKLLPGDMREIEFYEVSHDVMLVRYDAIGRDRSGREYQFHVDMSPPKTHGIDGMEELLQRRTLAKRMIEDKFAHDNLIAISPGDAKDFRMKLPHWGGRAAFV